MTVESLVNLLSDLRAFRITLRLDGRRLAWRGPKGAMTTDLKAAVADHKDALVVYLRSGALTVINPPVTPHRTRLRAELDARPALTWAQVDEIWALFEWYADSPLTEQRAFTVAMQRLRLIDQAQTHRRAG